MIYDLKKILDIGEENGFAVPAFNVYNLETVMGVIDAAKKAKAPVRRPAPPSFSRCTAACLIPRSPSTSLPSSGRP